MRQLYSIDVIYSNKFYGHINLCAHIKEPKKKFYLKKYNILIFKKLNIRLLISTFLISYVLKT